MSTEHILVTGANGQLGTDLMRLLASGFDMTGLDIDDIDITDPASVSRAIETHQPSVIINAAAFTNVDACETDEDTAHRVNADGARIIARACQSEGIRLVHFSTDYVFDGTKNTPYLETDKPNPQTAYGRTKLAGELFVQEELPDAVIIRIAWLYGAHGRNFVKTMLGLARKQMRTMQGGGAVTPLTVVDDQYGSPTCTEAIVRQTKRIIDDNLTGLLHATSQGETTWYGFAKAILESAGLAVDVNPCTTQQFPRPAPRPKRSTLDNARLRDAGADIMPHWQDSLTRFFADHKERL